MTLVYYYIQFTEKRHVIRKIFDITEVSRVQQLVSALQRQRQELSRAVRHLTQQSHVLQTTHDSMPGKNSLSSTMYCISSELNMNNRLQVVSSISFIVYKKWFDQGLWWCSS